VPLFFHTDLLFGDQEAWGTYLQEHGYEHRQFVQLGQLGTPGFLIPDYDLFSWEDSTVYARNWLTTHESVHEVIRGITGVSGINLADVNLANESEFYTWLDAHKQEHISIRQALGITT